MFTQVLLEHGIQFDVVLVVKDQVGLFLGVIRNRIRIVQVKGISIGGHRAFLGSKSALSHDGIFRKGTLVLFPKLYRGILPIIGMGFPFLSKSFFVYVSILTDDAKNAFWVFYRDAEADWGA